jgi:riboflavin biosynthesis pyrimidine reductase
MTRGLTTRLVQGASPVRIVVDSTLRLPLSAKVVTDGAAPTILATTARATHERRRAFADAGTNVLVLPATSDGRVDLGALLDQLGGRGATRC